jgi:hypothetical protein
MKHRNVILAVLFTSSLLIASPANAQQPQRGQMAGPDSMRGPMTRAMMRPGMMAMRSMHQRMMQNPLHRAEMMAFMLPALTDTLGLSDDQVVQINQLRSEVMTQRQEHQQQVMTYRQQLMDLFEGDEQPAPDSVRQHLLGMAELRATQRAAFYETAQQMREVLTPEQEQMLEGMTPQQQMRQMMSNMTMMEMMQMMRAMHGGMMDRRMMRNRPGMFMMHGPMGRRGGMQHHMRMHRNRQNQ